jgi:hypothetical protein
MIAMKKLNASVEQIWTLTTLRTIKSKAFRLHFTRALEQEHLKKREYKGEKGRGSKEDRLL